MSKLSNVKRIVVKIGSSTITNNGQRLDKNLISSLVDQITWLRSKYDIEVAIVSSGAIASGRLLEKSLGKSIIDTQVAAIFGQPILTAEWVMAFKKRGIIAGQALYTDDDLPTAEQTLSRALQVAPVIINANDAVCDREVRAFEISSDNDLLALYVAEKIKADVLILLTSVPGVFDQTGKLISQISCKNQTQIRQDGKSKLGTGGMDSKLKVSLDFAKQGKIAVIADGREKNIIGRIVAGEKIGTWVADRI